MDVSTTRFGVLSVESHDELIIEQGLIGMPELRRWIVLSDAQDGGLGWLQSLDQPSIALAVVAPRRFVPNYQLRASRSDLAALRLVTVRDAEIVVVVNRQEQGLSINLRAPIVINVETQRGCQVITKDDYPLQYMIAETPVRLKQSA